MAIVKKRGRETEGGRLVSRALVISGATSQKAISQQGQATKSRSAEGIRLSMWQLYRNGAVKQLSVRKLYNSLFGLRFSAFNKYSSAKSITYKYVSLSYNVFISLDIVSKLKFLCVRAAR